jgi:tetrapyrrole methylase family protein/MazG family protein
MRHPTIAWLTENEGVGWAGSFDEVYNEEASFGAVYERIALELLDAARRNGLIGFAVPGHPSFGERTVQLLRSLAGAEGVKIDFAPSQSYVDAVLEGEARADAPLRVLDALDLIAPPPPFAPEAEPLDPSALHLIYQVYDHQIASDLKLALLEMYPPDAAITIVNAAGVPGEQRRMTRTLAELDHAGAVFNHLTTLLVPPLDRPELFHGYVGLASIMARLRDPDGGCPWDREQTPKKLRRYLLEEAHEVLEALDEGDEEAYAEELGDLLLQVFFHAQIAREEGRFGMRDILRTITSKLVRRHPHVFGDVEARDSEQVLANWAAIKKSEKGYEERKSLLDGVPRSLPALMRAQEISRRAAKAGFEWGSIDGVFEKLQEEVRELQEAIEQDDDAAIEDEIGDLLFTAVNLARFRKVEAEDSLVRMVERFSRRFRRIEEVAAQQGRVVSDLTIDEMERVWQLAKRE